MAATMTTEKLNEELLITIQDGADPKIGRAMVSGRPATYIRASTHAEAAELFLQWLSS